MVDRVLFDIHGVTDIAVLCAQFRVNYSLTVLVERSWVGLGSYLELDGERLVYHIFLTTGEDGLSVKYYTDSFDSFRNELLLGKTYSDLGLSVPCFEVDDLYSFLSELNIVGYITVLDHPKAINDISTDEVVSLYLDGSKFSLDGHKGFSSLIFIPSNKLHSELELNLSEVAGIVDVYSRIQGKSMRRFLKLSQEDYSSVLGIYHYPPTSITLPAKESLGVGLTYRLNNHEVVTLSKLVSTALGEIHWITLDGSLYNLNGERIFKRDEDKPRSKGMFDVIQRLPDKNEMAILLSK